MRDPAYVEPLLRTLHWRLDLARQRERLATGRLARWWCRRRRVALQRRLDHLEYAFGRLAV